MRSNSRCEYTHGSRAHDREGVQQNRREMTRLDLPHQQPTMLKDSQKFSIMYVRCAATATPVVAVLELGGGESFLAMSLQDWWAVLVVMIVDGEERTVPIMMSTRISLDGQNCSVPMTSSPRWARRCFNITSADGCAASCMYKPGMMGLQNSRRARCLHPQPAAMPL